MYMFVELKFTFSSGPVFLSVVERFSLGVRNPTAFLAGSLVSKYFYISLHDTVDYVLELECEYTCADINF